MSEQEAEARAVNAHPWEPPPGMVKRQCGHCRYFFAVPINAEAGLLCSDCCQDGG